MKGKLLQKLIAVALVLCMTATNFIFVAVSTVYALSATAELEGGNVVFEAYFKSEDKKATQKTANISQGEKLYLSLELKAGKLQEGKVKINNANFKIVENAVNSKFINSINAQTNEIVLNEISYNDSKQGAIELEIPIKFEEADKINTAYFEMENNIILSGKYFNSSETGKNIQSNPISTKLIWSESNVSVGWNANIEKVIYLENKTLVQASIQSTYKDTYFPKESEKITINIPKVNNITPTYTILADGDKVDLNKITNSVTEETISFTNEFKNGENIVWNKSGNIYKVIYVYEGINRLEDPLQLKASIETKLLERDKTVSKELNFNSNVPQGTIASVDAKSISGEVYKGYMYANSDETIYEEEYNMELSSVKDLKSTLELQEDNFKTENGNISTNGKTQYKEIKINKAKLVAILGKNGKLEIIPSNKNLSSVMVDANTQADENGNIVIKENQISSSHNVTLNVISAENEGTLKITVKKAIIGNAGYNKEILKTINAIETTVKSYTNNLDKVSNAVAVTPLKETVTKATIEMNNNNILSTLNTNNIEFVATIKTGTMDTDLLKAPTIKIVLPEEVEKIELTSKSSALYVGQELKVESTEVVDNGKAILVKLDGEQFKYDNKLMESIKITVYANITLNKSAISRENAEVLMEYTNENSADKKYTASTKVNIQAPYGLMTEAIVNCSFETINKGIEILKTRITNNYEKPIEEIALIGKIPNVKKSKEEFEKYLKDNLKTTLNEINIEVKYSQDGEEFNDNFENAKNYKIVFKNTKLATGEKLTISHQIETNKILSEFKLVYVYEGIERAQDLKIDKIDSNKPENIEIEKSEVVEKDKLVIEMIAKAQEGEVTENTTLLQNQVIRYTYKIKNNSNENINNVDLKVKHENANIFEERTEQQVNTAKPDEQLNFTFEVETDKSEKEFAIGTLKPSEIKEITYQARIKEDAKTLKTTVEVSAKDIETIKVEKENKVEAAPVKLEITNNVAKEYPLQAEKIFANTLSIKNTSNETLKNVMVNFSIPKEYEYYEIYELTDSSNYKLLQSDKNYLVFSINELAPGVTKELNVALKVVEEKPKVNVSRFNYTVTVGKDTYTSNDTEVPIKEFVKSNIQVKMTSNIEGTVKTGDSLIYKTQIKNIGNNADSITFLDFVPEAAPIKNAYYTIGNEQTKIENVNDNTILEVIPLKAGEEANIYIETQIDEALTGKEEITNSATIAGNFLLDLIKTEEIKHKLQANIKEENKEENEKQDGEGKPQDVVDSNIDVKQSISGLVWVDTNKNGIRETSEKTLEGITVALGNVETGKYVTDNDGNKLEVKTNEKGEYKFENISNGKYIVVFKYDNVKYRNTEYRANGIAENVNSDIITSKISTDNEDIKYGITDTLELNENSLENIDAGFIENEVFDLSLNKYITKVTVQNSSGTITKQYSKEQLAKIEIDSKNLAASTVLVEYAIEIKNEGEIAGYANEIVDYIPKDLSFSSQINKDWYISTDGNLHTTALAKELINPGETKTITLTLVKTMTENNTGLTTNKAEIVKSSNELAIPDKDSKAGNNVQNEDDISTAELIISIRTGIEFTIGIIIAIIAITALGIVVYTKKRKEANHE